jgi:hypothetical protein
MAKTRPMFDVDFWNLDYLERRPELARTGYVRRVQPYPPLAAADKVGLLNSEEVILLRQEERRIELIEPRRSTHHEIFRFSAAERPSGLAVVGRDLFLVEAAQRSVVKLTVGQHRVDSETRFPLSGFDGNLSTCGLAVLPAAGEEPATAYLGPFRGELVAAPLCERAAYRSLPLELGVSTLEDSGFHLCADSRNRSLLLTELVSGNILEVSADNGSILLFLTSDNPRFAVTHKGRPRPLATAVYPTCQCVPAIAVTQASRRVLESDPKRVRPRTILIADAGHACLWKLVQMPGSGLLLNLNSKTELLPFVGSASSPDTPNEAHIALEDLRRYRLGTPLQLTVSESGALVVLVLLEGQPSLLMLTPATTASENIALQRARGGKFDSSD